MEFEVRCGGCETVLRSGLEGLGSTITCGGCQCDVALPRKTLAPGLLLSERYLLLEEVGRGGFAQVWRAEQKSTGRVVAVKILHFSHRDQIVERFRREVKRIAQIDHPLIVHAFDAGEDNDMHYLVMAYVPGKTLQDVVRDAGPLPEPEALSIVAQVAEAMSIVWNRFGLVHRDIKPANLMLTPERTVKLLDLGIALTQGEGHTMTPTGGMIGSVPTMSPEQIETPHDVDCQSDLYALGCTLFFLLTGKYPFEGSTVSILQAQVNQAPPNPQTLRPSISDDTTELVLHLLEKDPAHRPKGWNAVLAQLPESGQLNVLKLAPDAFFSCLEPVAPSGRQNADASSKPTWLRVLIPSLLLLLAGLIATPFILSARSNQAEVPHPLGINATPAQTSQKPSSLPIGDRKVDPNLRNLDAADWPEEVTYLVTSNEKHLIHLPMNLVQPDRFIMGRTEAERAAHPDVSRNHSTAHKVTISQPFYLAVTECTYEQFCTVVGYTQEDPAQRLRPAFDLLWKQLGENDFYKGLHDSRLAAALDRRYGALLPDGYEFRLPTEAEWEYACRAGTTSTFPFGDNEVRLKEFANYDDRSTIEVASLKPNPWGFYDMLGNASEWVLDGYAPYPKDGASRVDPYHPNDGVLPNRVELRMRRGGSFRSSNPLECSPGYRLPFEHYRREAYVGFRLAVAPVIKLKRPPGDPLRK